MVMRIGLPTDFRSNSLESNHVGKPENYTSVVAVTRSLGVGYRRSINFLTKVSEPRHGACISIMWRKTQVSQE